MSSIAFPTLNGIAPSWADITTTATVSPAGPLIDMSAYSDISCGDALEIGTQRGAGPYVSKRTTGQLSQEAKATFYRDGWRALQRGLMAIAPRRLTGLQVQLGLVHFDILIQHTPPGELDVYVLKIKGCRIAGRNFNFAEGPDPDKVEIPLNPIEIVEIIDGQEVVLV